MLTGDGAVILSRCSTLLVTVLAACLGFLPFSGRAQVTEELVRSYLWPQTEAELDRAEDALALVDGLKLGVPNVESVGVATPNLVGEGAQERGP